MPTDVEFPQISIVVPTHNEEENVIELHRRLTKVFTSLEMSFELIFVDDSTDRTTSIIEGIIEEDSNVKLIRLTRSFGQANAISAGVDFANGSAIIMMDADLQDPPELIPEFVSRWKNGFAVVYASRLSQGNFLYRFLSHKFYKIQSRLSNTHVAENAGEFRLIDKRVADFIRDLPERNRYLRGQTLWPGYKSCSIFIDRQERLNGETKYNLRKSFSVAISGLIAFSTKPLRVAVTFSILLVFLIFLLIFTYIIMRNITPNSFSPGWLSLLIAILGVGALNLFILGIIGEYVGQLFEQVQGRPRYVIDYIKQR
jgi:glycosyltransferase involved in cell wall biosynthesis